MRAADLRIVERRRLAVDDQVGADAGAAHGALRAAARRVLMFLSSGTVTSVGKVMSNLPLTKDSMRVERSGMMRVLDAVEIGPARLPVVGVLHQLDALVHLELDELERAGADRLAAHVGRPARGRDRSASSPTASSASSEGWRLLEMEGRLRSRRRPSPSRRCCTRRGADCAAACSRRRAAGRRCRRRPWRVNGLPSCHFTPWRSVKTERLAVVAPRPSLVARSGTIDSRLFLRDMLVEHDEVVVDAP